MSTTQTILLTGSTGLLGKGVEETVPKGWRILGIHQRDYAVAGSRIRHLPLDIRDKSLVDKLFARRRFAAVVHAGGIASVDYVENHYAESLESNIVGTLNVSSACRRAGTHLIYVSTNAVFDGKAAPYRETAPVRPVNKYGRIKVECERLVTETNPGCTIVRPILMYGWNHVVTRPNTATWIYDKLLRGERIHMVTDVFENPLFNLQCGRAVWAAVRKKPQGVVHVAGKDKVNRWQFALKVAQVFGLDAKLVTPVKSSFFPGIAPRPRNTTLATERMRRELGVAPMTLEEGLLHMRSAMRVP
ncbi:MAG: SDR family oxidoreductase [Elusimicrobia bacterium]|nr:SDR family oxidoreductase [Elusimicrobiota bacterium]